MAVADRTKRPRRPKTRTLRTRQSRIAQFYLSALSASDKSRFQRQTTQTQPPSSTTGGSISLIRTDGRSHTTASPADERNNPLTNDSARRPKRQELPECSG